MAAGESGPASSTSPAVGRALDVLQYLARKLEAVPAASIVRDVGIPRSSAYHLLRVLLDRGFVVYLPEARGYALGPAALDLASADVHHDQLERFARPILAATADRIGLTVHLGVLRGHNTLYLIKAQPTRPAEPEPTLVTAVGVQLPGHLTANGRAILAQLGADHVRALFSRPGDFVSRTGRGPRSLAELQTKLDAERAQGYSEERELIAPGLRSAGVAVFDLHDAAVAAVSTTWRARVATHELDDVVDRLRVGAQEITKRLQGRAR